MFSQINKFTKNFQFSFFFKLCMRSCLADAQIAKCGCAESQYAVNMEGICEKSYDPSVGAFISFYGH